MRELGTVLELTFHSWKHVAWVFNFEGQLVPFLMYTI